MKYLKYSLKPFTVVMLFMVMAMVATRETLAASQPTEAVTAAELEASKDPKKVPSAELPKQATADAPPAKTSKSRMAEVVVSGNQDKRTTYKPTALSSSKYTEPLRDIPQSIAVVPQGVMVDRNAVTLRDTLRNVPGIAMQAGEGGVPAGDNLSIRGFNARTDMFVDGVRDFGGYTRDSFNLEQVEVTKGPTSSYEGRGSAGGAINQVSKTPELDTYYRGTVGFGSAYYKRTTFDFNQQIKEINIPGTAFRINGMFFDGDTPGRDEVTSKRWGIAPSLALGLETSFRAIFSYFYMGQDNMPDYGIPWVPAANARGALIDFAEKASPVDWSNFYGLTDRDYERTGTHVFTNKLEYDYSEELKFKNQFRFGSTSRDSIITAPRFASANNQLINRQVQSRDQVDGIMDNQTYMTYKFDTGPLEHTTVTGVQFSRESSDNRPRTGPATPLADLWNPEPGQTYGSDISITPFENEAIAKTLSLYLSDTIQLTEQLQLVGGVRWDYFDVNYDPAVGDDLERIDKLFNWRGGIVYKPVEIGSFYFGYGTSYNPSGEGLALGSAATAANNIALDPEKTRTFEIGTKWDVLKEKLALTGAIFRTDKTNARTTDPGTSAATTDDILVLEGNQRVLGFELGANGNITEEWKVYGAYTRLNSRITKSKTEAEVGVDLPNTPKSSFSIWTTYDLPLGFQIGGGLQFVGDVYNSSAANRRVAPGYWLFDAMLAKKISESITLRLNATNLTNQEYIGSVGGGHFIPGAGRQVVATTEFEF